MTGRCPVVGNLSNKRMLEVYAGLNLVLNLELKEK